MGLFWTPPSQTSQGRGAALLPNGSRIGLTLGYNALF